MSELSPSAPASSAAGSPQTAHHLRFAQSRALGRKVSDEFTVPLCRGHHREVHRCGDEADWWRKFGINPMCGLRRTPCQQLKSTVRLRTRPLSPEAVKLTPIASAAGSRNQVRISRVEDGRGGHQRPDKPAHGFHGRSMLTSRTAACSVGQIHQAISLCYRVPAVR